MDTRFHCVYLLTSLDPQCVGEYYIGYTVNPIRRNRQHNGELVNGAWRTRRRGRPWQLLCCVSGFGEDRIALKFEWCWQYPRKSSRLKAHMVHLRGVHRLPYAIGVLHFLLRADLFSRLQLTLHIFEAERFEEVVSEVMRLAPAVKRLEETSLLRIEAITKEQFQTQYLDETEGGEGVMGADGCVYFMAAPISASQPGVDATAGQSIRCSKYLCEEDILRQHARERTLMESGHYPCSLCTLPLKAPYVLRCSRTPFCALRVHLPCLAMWFTHSAMEQRKHKSKEAKRASEGVVGALVDPGLSGRTPALARVNNGDGSMLSNGNSNGNIAAASGTSNIPQSPKFPVPTGYGSRCSSSPGRASSTADITLVPSRPCPCPLCNEMLHWGALVHDLKRRATLERRWTLRRRRERMEAMMSERLQHIKNSSLAELEGRKRATRLDKKRRRDVMEAGQLQCSFNHVLGDSANDTSVSLPVSLWGEVGAENGSRSGFHTRRGGARVEEQTKHTSITDLCDSVLQLTDFSAEDWLDL